MLSDKLQQIYFQAIQHTQSQNPAQINCEKYISLNEITYFQWQLETKRKQTIGFNAQREKSKKHISTCQNTVQLRVYIKL